MSRIGKKVIDLPEKTEISVSGSTVTVKGAKGTLSRTFSPDLLVKAENKIKAEDIVKKDDIVNRGSITIKQPASLGFKEDGFFLVIDAQPEAIKHAEKLLKGVAEKYKNKEEVLKKIKEEEDKAIEGLGNILG